MKKTAFLLCLMFFVTSFVFSQSKPRHKIANSARDAKSKQVQKPPRSGSIVGLDFYSVTPDHAGGVWITGNAYLVQGLMVNDRRGQVRAITVPNVGAIDHPIFVTREMGWMIDVRSLFRTFDEGNEWLRIDLPGQPAIRTLYFKDTNNGWAGGWEGDIYHTVDAGQVWAKQETGLDYEFDQIFFVDNLHGWAVGGKNYTGAPQKQALIRTNDGGEHWEILANEKMDSGGVVHPIFFVNENDGWAIDGWSNIVRTVNGGKTWTIQSPRDDQSLNSLFFINDREGWAAGDGILHTADGGETWDYQWLRKQGENYLEGITFTDRDHGWAIGLDGALRTTDGGKTWELMPDDWKATIPSYERLLKGNAMKDLRKQR